MAIRVTPGVVANTFLRYLLTQAGLLADGFSATQWQQTLAYFDNRCVYTSQLLPGKAVEQDHAVPMNRAAGGLHVFGNVVPAAAQANREKGGLRYDVFLRSKGERFSSLAHLTDAQREENIARIEEFMQTARPDSLLAPHPELLAFYASQYEQAKQLCAGSVEQLTELLAKLNLAETPIDEAVNAPQDAPSPEQFELEERDVETLPEPYGTIQERGSQTGVGAYAQAVFAQLFADGRIAGMLPNLTYREDSFMAFKLSYPALITQRVGESTKRYYATPYRHNGTDYYLCSQWRERHRDYLDAWLTTVTTSRA